MKARVFSTVQLNELARECLDALRPQTEAKHLTTEIVGAPNLELVAVRAEIEIVFNNLLTNAIKYNREGGSVDDRVQHVNKRFAKFHRDSIAARAFVPAPPPDLVHVDALPFCRSTSVLLNSSSRNSLSTSIFS